MICKKCGATIPDDSQSCQYCGETLNVHETDAVVEAVTEEPKTESEGQVASTAPVPESVPTLVPETVSAPVSEQVSASVPADGNYFPQNENTPVAAAAYTANDAAKRKSNKKILIPILISLVLIIGACVAVGAVFLNSPAAKLTNALLKTGKVLADEASILVEKNPVLSRIGELGKEGFEFYTYYSDGEYETELFLDLDPKKEVLAIEVPVEGTDLIAFWDNEYISFGVKDVSLIGIPTKNAGSAIKKFASNMVSDMDEMFDMLDQYDFSLHNMLHPIESAELPETNKQLNKELDAIRESLLKTMTVSEKNGEIQLGDKTKKCDIIAISIDSETLNNWVKSDFIPMLKDSKTLYSKIDEALKANTGTSSVKSADELIELIEESIDTEEDASFEISYYICEGIIRKVNMTSVQDDTVSEIEITAADEKHLLNNIYLTAREDDEEEFTIGFNGNIVGEEKVDFVFSASDEEFHVVWDTKGTEDNFSITDSYDDGISLTFAKDSDNDVVVEFYDDYDEIYLLLTELSYEIEVPDNIISIEDMTESDLYMLLFAITSM